MNEPISQLLIAQIRHRIQERWTRGGRDPLESLISDDERCQLCDDHIWELIVEEIRIRGETAEKPALAEYLKRFPRFQDRLRLLPDLEETWDGSLPGTLTAIPPVDEFAPTVVPAGVQQQNRENLKDNSGEKFGDYELLGEIARGGMGVVYRARHIRLHRLVALKMILAGRLASHDAIRRFYTEAEAAARLDHPGIVPIFEIGQNGDQHFFTMAFIEGGNLARRVKDGPMSATEASATVEQIAHAIQYAHEHSVLHRDLKPGNILLDRDGMPKVTDFGLAKMVDQDSSLSSTGDILGTPSYMAPEQASGNTADIGPAADVYAIGAVLYCLITGRPPFQAASLLETLRQVREVEPVGPRLVNPDVPRDLETICLKCLQKGIHQRYASAGELAKELQRFQRGEPIRARPVSFAEHTWRWCWRNPISASMVCVSIALILMSFVAITLQGQIAVKESGRRAAEDLATTERYFASINEVREAASKPRVSWTWKSLDTLRNAAATSSSSRDELTLRNLAAHCVMQSDLRELHAVSPFGSGTIRGVAFDFNGRRIAVGKHKGGLTLDVALYDTARLTLIRQFSTSIVNESVSQLLALKTKYQEGVSGLCFSPDGKYLVVGTRLGKIYVWDTTAPLNPPISWQAHEKSVERLVFSSSGMRLYSSATETRAWQVRDKAWTREQSFDQPFAFIAIHPDGEHIAATQNDHVFVSRAHDATILSAWGSPQNKFVGLSRPAWHPSGHLLFASERSGLKFLDPVSGREVATMNDANASGQIGRNGIEFAANGSLVITADEDLRVRIWDIANGKLLMTTPTFASDDEHQLAVSDKAGIVAVIAGKLLTIFELRAGDSCRAIGVAPCELGAFDISHNGSMLATITERSGPKDDSSLIHTAIKWSTDTGLPLDMNTIVTPFRPTIGQTHDEPAAITFNNSDSEMFVATAHFGVYGWHGNESIQISSYPSLEPFNIEFTPLDTSALSVTRTEQRTTRQLKLDNTSTLNLRVNKSDAQKLPGDAWAILARMRTERFPWGTATIEFSANQPLAKFLYQLPTSSLPRQGTCWMTIAAFHREGIENGEDFQAELKLPAGFPPLNELIEELVAIPFLKPRGQSVEDRAAPFLTPMKNGQSLVGIIGNESQIALWKIPALTLVSRFDNSASLSSFTSGMSSMSCLDAGRTKIVAGMRRGTLLIANESQIASPKAVSLTPTEAIRAVILTGNERRIAAGTSVGHVRWIDESGSLVHEWQAHEEAITALAANWDCSLLITSGEDKSIRFWAQRDDKFDLLLSLDIGTRAVSRMRYCEDTRQLAVQIRGERAVRLIDLDRIRDACQAVGVSWWVRKS